MRKLIGVANAEAHQWQKPDYGRGAQGSQTPGQPPGRQAPAHKLRIWQNDLPERAGQRKQRGLSLCIRCLGSSDRREAYRQPKSRVQEQPVKSGGQMQEFVLMRPEKEIERSSIAGLEKLVGFKLPASFVQLYLKSNGGIPSRSWVVTEDGYEPMQISDFKTIFFEGAENASDTGFIEGCYKLMCERHVIPHTLLPFATDDGGNFFCLDMLNGCVVFYAVDTFREDVSMAANQIAAQRMVAKSFDQFIAELEEEPKF